MTEGTVEVLSSEVRRQGNDARTAAVYLIRRLTDEKPTTLANQFGGVSEAAISKLSRRAELRRQEDPHWNSLLEQLERTCRSKGSLKKLKVKT